MGVFIFIDRLRNKFPAENNRKFEIKITISSLRFDRDCRLGKCAQRTCRYLEGAASPERNIVGKIYSYYKGQQYIANILHIRKSNRLVGWSRVVPFLLDLIDVWNSIQRLLCLFAIAQSHILFTHGWRHDTALFLGLIQLNVINSST